jgi:hypothetical protein
LIAVSVAAGVGRQSSTLPIASTARPASGGSSFGDDTMAESAVVPRLRADRQGRLVDRRAPWAYDEMAVVDWEID